MEQNLFGTLGGISTLDKEGFILTAEPWVSVDYIAKHLDVAKDSVYRWIEKKEMPAHKMGRLWKFKVSEVNEWVHAGERGSDILWRPSDCDVQGANEGLDA